MVKFLVMVLYAVYGDQSMTKYKRRIHLIRALIFGAALFLNSAFAGAEPTGGAGTAVLFNMQELLDVEPYDIGALEELFASGCGESNAGVSNEAGISAPAAGFALARALSLSGEPEKARKALEKTASLLGKGRDPDAAGTTLAAHVFLELIVDGPTWMRYDLDLENAIAAMEKTGAPQPDVTYVKAKRFTLFPPEIGGDLVRGLELFASIAGEDTLFEYSTRYASALIAVGNRAEARALWKSV